jgi:5'-nucleotidase
MDNVIIVNPPEFEKKKIAFLKGGADSIQVVTDFDRTLTRAFDKGKKVGTAIAQIRNNNYLSIEYTKKAFDLFNYYQPLEYDDKILMKEKIGLMEEWWTKHLDLLVSSGMNRGIIEDIVKKNYLPAREGLTTFMNFLKAKKIPILILSSGLGDIIDGFLSSKKLLSKNVCVISNYFDFDSNGRARGYKGKIVHVFNKDESSIKGTPFFDKIASRKNILLLGDSIGDLKMTANISFNEIIRVGFFNGLEGQSIKDFEKNFDIIITNDGSLEVVNALLLELFA